MSKQYRPEVALLIRDRIKKTYASEFCQGVLDEGEQAEKEFYEAFMTYLFALSASAERQNSTEDAAAGAWHEDRQHGTP